MNNFIYGFYDSKKIGKNGEKIIYEYIKDNYKFKNLKDVSDDKEYRDKDIDFIMEYTDGISYGIELKTDTFNSGNIFFEIVSSDNIGSSGCMLKTEAYFLFYYFISTNKLYIFNMNKYKEWVLDNIEKFRKVTVNNKTYKSCGLLIPIQIIESKFNKKYYRKVVINKCQS